MLTLAPIRDLAAFEDLSLLWEALLSHAPGATVFHTFSWQQAWLRHLGGRGELLLLLIKDGKEPVGIAPCVIRRQFGLPFRRLQWVGTGVSDYLGPIFLAERSADILDLVTDWLSTRHHEWDVLDLQGLSDDSPFLAAIRQVKGSKPPPCRWHPNAGAWHVLEQAVCPYVSLPDSWAEFTRGLSRRVRYNLGYYLRLLQRDHRVNMERVPAIEVEVEMERFFHLHTRRWRMRWLPGVLSNPRIRRFHQAASRALEAEDRLRLYRLRVDDETVASLYCFRVGRRGFYYLGGFKPEMARFSVGSVLTGYAMQSLLEEGCDEFDFLRGREAYKYRWRCQERRNWRVVGEKPSSASRLATQAITLEQQIADRYEAWAHGRTPERPS